MFLANNLFKNETFIVGKSTHPSGKIILDGDGIVVDSKGDPIDFDEETANHILTAPGYFKLDDSEENTKGEVATVSSTPKDEDEDNDLDEDNGDENNSGEETKPKIGDTRVNEQTGKKQIFNKNKRWQNVEEE